MDIYDRNIFQVNREEFIKFIKESRKEPPALSYPFPKNRLIFFLLDIEEVNTKQPGHLYLFGKTYDYEKDLYVSCCVSVKYCDKLIYLLPREFFADDPTRKVSWEDICDEFAEQIVPKIETKQIECNQVTKKYAFDDSVPAETEYLEIKCKVGNFKLRDKPGKTYSRILGINTGYKEIFMLKRNIKGPCWVEITNYKVDLQKSSQCKLNFECHDIQDITPIVNDMIPPIILMGLEFKTFKNKGNDKNIVSVSCIVETFTKNTLDSEHISTITDHFCILSTRHFTYNPKLAEEYAKTCSHTNIKIADEEAHLLMQLFDYIDRVDPDILYGHNMIGHTIDLIYSKIVKHQMFLKNYYKIPKIILTRVPPAKFKMDLFRGRILCDTKIIAEEMVKSRSFSIHDLSEYVLKIPHCDMQNDTLQTLFRDVEYLSDFIYTIMWDITCVHKFLENLRVMELLIEISRICGNTVKSSCNGYLSNRCEYLLLHKYHAMNYILPSRYFNKSKKKTVSLVGGLVLEPDVGLHKNFVIALDFNALYPSIIQEYNICFTTMKEDNSSYVDVYKEGVLPNLIGELLTERKRILHKLSMINQNETDYYVQNLKIKQEIIKRMTNSIYGYIGSNNSRFMAKHLANFITEKGRHILSGTVELLTDNSYKVIYGDTDSVMIATNLQTYEEVVKLTCILTEMINSQYKYVNIQKGGIYKPFLILRKKKYAGLKINSDGTSTEDIKGLDVVRRDWSAISSIMARKVLSDILTGTQNLANVICEYLTCKRQDLIDNYHNYNDELFMICKKLSKDPENYGNKDNYEHVKVARKYNQQYPNTFRAHDIVCYVVCLDGSDRSCSERVYHMDEYRNSNYLKIDINYYISQQIYPVVKRICDGIKDIVDSRDLLAALDIDCDSYEVNVEQYSKKAKVSTVPKYNSLLNFRLLCSICKISCLISYDSLECIKSCNCNRSFPQNFRAKLSMFVNNTLRTYKQMNRTFKEADYILSRLRFSIELNKKNDEKFLEYLKVIDDCKKILLSDFDCKNLHSKEIFNVVINVKLF